MIALGSIPGKAEALSSATHDKFLHVTAYSALSVLLYIGLGGSRQLRVLGTVTLVAILGLVDETIQYFLPYRNSEAWDWLFNMMAAALSVAFCGALHPLFTARGGRISTDEHVRRNIDRTN